MAICETCDYANRPPYKSPCSECDKTMGSPFCCYEHEEKPTNADRFHSATNDALKEEIHAISLGFKPWCDHHCANEGDDGCDNCIGEWLKQPAED